MSFKLETNKSITTLFWLVKAETVFEHETNDGKDSPNIINHAAKFNEVAALHN